MGPHQVTLYHLAFLLLHEGPEDVTQPPPQLPIQSGILDMKSSWYLQSRW